MQTLESSSSPRPCLTKVGQGVIIRFLTLAPSWLES